MSGEFINRFTNKVHLRYLSPDQEFEVLKSYGPGWTTGSLTASSRSQATSGGTMQKSTGSSRSL